ncbi:hypothetical protein C8R47DRAFT_1235085 [Mycena vitilis]|nr:hypothetical protein C8R47DRAFT_1235085 [Mycena vitilis]
MPRAAANVADLRARMRAARRCLMCALRGMCLNAAQGVSGVHSCWWCPSPSAARTYVRTDEVQAGSGVRGDARTRRAVHVTELSLPARRGTACGGVAGDVTVLRERDRRGKLPYNAFAVWDARAGAVGMRARCEDAGRLVAASAALESVREREWYREVRVHVWGAVRLGYIHGTLRSRRRRRRCSRSDACGGRSRARCIQKAGARPDASRSGGDVRMDGERRIVVTLWDLSGYARALRTARLWTTCAGSRPRAKKTAGTGYRYITLQFYGQWYERQIKIQQHWLPPQLKFKPGHIGLSSRVARNWVLTQSRFSKACVWLHAPHGLGRGGGVACSIQARVMTGVSKFVTSRLSVDSAAEVPHSHKPGSMLTIIMLWKLPVRLSPESQVYPAQLEALCRLGSGRGTEFLDSFPPASSQFNQRDFTLRTDLVADGPHPRKIRFVVPMVLGLPVRFRPESWRETANNLFPREANQVPASKTESKQRSFSPCCYGSMDQDNDRYSGQWDLRLWITGLVFPSRRRNSVPDDAH